MEIYHNTKGETPEAIKAKTGCTTIVNGMLFNPDGTFCLKARVNGLTLANESGAFYGYGWSGNTLPVISHSDNMNSFDNYITSIHVVPTIKRGRTAVSFYDGKYTVLCTSDSNGALTIPEVEAKMKKYNSQFLILDGGGSSYLNCPSGKVDTTMQRKTANRMYLLIWEDVETQKEDDTVSGINIIQPNYKWAYGATIRQKTDYIVLHHVGAIGSFTPEQIHAEHLKKGWRGIGYNFYVRKDGTIYHGREENAAGGHTLDYNLVSIGICFEGNFEVETMTDAQKKAGQALIAYLKPKYPTAQIVRHKQLNATACPGKNFPFADITTVTPATPTTTPTSNTIYRVQVGAFTDKLKADNLVKDLTAKGYKPYITTEVKA